MLLILAKVNSPSIETYKDIFCQWKAQWQFYNFCLLDLSKAPTSFVQLLPTDQDRLFCFSKRFSFWSITIADCERTMEEFANENWPKISPVASFAACVFDAMLPTWSGNLLTFTTPFLGRQRRTKPRWFVQFRCTSH